MVKTIQLNLLFLILASTIKLNAIENIKFSQEIKFCTQLQMQTWMRSDFKILEVKIDKGSISHTLDKRIIDKSEFEYFYKCLTKLNIIEENVKEYLEKEKIYLQNLLYYFPDYKFNDYFCYSYIGYNLEQRLFPISIEENYFQTPWGALSKENIENYNYNSINFYEKNLSFKKLNIEIKISYSEMNCPEGKVVVQYSGNKSNSFCGYSQITEWGNKLLISKSYETTIVDKDKIHTYNNEDFFKEVLHLPDEFIDQTRNGQYKFNNKENWFEFNSRKGIFVFQHKYNIYFLIRESFNHGNFQLLKSKDHEFYYITNDEIINYKFTNQKPIGELKDLITRIGKKLNYQAIYPISKLNFFNKIIHYVPKVHLAQNHIFLQIFNGKLKIRPKEMSKFFKKDNNYLGSYYVKNLSPLKSFDCNKGNLAMSQCKALVDLYNYTQGQNWRNNKGWLTKKKLINGQD